MKKSTSSQERWYCNPIVLSWLSSSPNSLKSGLSFWPITNWCSTLIMYPICNSDFLWWCQPSIEPVRIPFTKIANFTDEVNKIDIKTKDIRNIIFTFDDDRDRRHVLAAVKSRALFRITKKSTKQSLSRLEHQVFAFAHYKALVSQDPQLPLLQKQHHAIYSLHREFKQKRIDPSDSRHLSPLSTSHVFQEIF